MAFFSRHLNPAVISAVTERWILVTQDKTLDHLGFRRIRRESRLLDGPRLQWGCPRICLSAGDVTEPRYGTAAAPAACHHHMLKTSPFLLLRRKDPPLFYGICLGVPLRRHYDQRCAL